MEKPPLIVSLQLPADAFGYFNNLRKEHFPPGRNFLDAHLTLFHHLPNDPFIVSDLATMASEHPIIPLQVIAVSFIGNGVAFKIESSELKTLHRKLQQLWKPYLTRQDQQSLWPHITVQNKVPAAQAKTLAEKLASEFKPFSTQGIGLALWEYHNGPWQLMESFLFRQ